MINLNYKLNLEFSLHSMDLLMPFHIQSFHTVREDYGQLFHTIVYEYFQVMQLNHTSLNVSFVNIVHEQILLFEDVIKVKVFSMIYDKKQTSWFF